MTKYTYAISDASGKRLDAFLSTQDCDLSRSFIQKLIENSEAILVNGKVQKANYRLKNGDIVTIDVPEPQKLAIEPENIPLDILYEDNDIIVVNKKRGMTVHPAPGVYSGTLVNALLYHCHDLSGINGMIRPGIVHRLDKDTSGVMVVAKNDTAHLCLAEQIAQKKAVRTYLAIINGHLAQDRGKVEGNIGRSPADRKKMAVLYGKGKPATTLFRALERFKRYSLIQCRLLTGRTHQIRVHMAHIGHPLLGDPRYSKCKNPLDKKIEGQALHSLTLELTHPKTGQKMRFVAPLPYDMRQILTKLRKRG